VKLWLLRHARVILDAGLCYGASDVPADAALTQQAAELAAAVLPSSLPLWVSGLGRAQQLASALQALRSDLPMALVDKRLNEMDFGRWELRRWDDVPRAAFDIWLADFAHHRFGGGESTQQVIDRVADAMDAVRESGVSEAVWITHAGVIRAAQFVAEHGRGPISGVAQWPRKSPQPGGHCCLQL
jgi:alpha-ribazole phosphatase